ncbi:hypothetical protein [Peterkaempfera sp. SMS 1(5)a]|uniref:hypothetical protein n=1 Tax=Peterkaempfera podocarpi TaxID=3232308 RepID=UPI0036709B19
MLPKCALVVALVVVGTSACASQPGTQPDKAPSSHRTYLHPVGDLSRVLLDCDSEHQPYLTLWVTNHSQRSVAYDIKYNVLDQHGRVVGSAEGVFELAPSQTLANQPLFVTTGTCGHRARLAMVNAYVADGSGQPSFD